jgi:hypothetical protein
MGPVMATDKDLYAETICGLMDYYGERNLARILNVTVDDLYRWSSGSRPPSEVFFRIVNLSRADKCKAVGALIATANTEYLE